MARNAPPIACPEAGYKAGNAAAYGVRGLTTRGSLAAAPPAQCRRAGGYMPGMWKPLSVLRISPVRPRDWSEARKRATSPKLGARWEAQPLLDLFDGRLAGFHVALEPGDLLVHPDRRERGIVGQHAQERLNLVEADVGQAEVLLPALDLLHLLLFERDQRL